jgi:cytochrome c oxidase subunit 2
LEVRQNWKVRTLRRHDDTPAPLKRRGLTLAGLAVACALVLSGCGEQLKRGYLPHGVTENSVHVISLWNWSWTAALAVGALVWGLIGWCVVAYRRKKDDVGLPEQLRYNVPLEILYTVVPLFMVAVLFFYTARDETALLNVSQTPDVTVNVVGKQWSWDFNYIEAKTYESGTQAELTGKPGVQKTLPTLYLPVHKRTEFVLTARDVIHSFWVPQFLQKLDMIPGKVNRFEVVPTETGVFQGKCAELCGAYHSQMLFQVRVVTQEQFDAHMKQLRASGNIGALDNSLSREPIEKQQQQFVPSEAAATGSSN